MHIFVVYECPTKSFVTKVIFSLVHLKNLCQFFINSQRGPRLFRPIAFQMTVITIGGEHIFYEHCDRHEP